MDRYSVTGLISTTIITMAVTRPLYWLASQNRIRKAINKDRVVEALVMAEKAHSKGWCAEKFFREKKALPDWEVVATLVEAANELWTLRRNALHAQASGVSADLMRELMQGVGDALEVLWRRADRIAAVAAQDVTENVQEVEEKTRRSLLRGVTQHKIITRKTVFKFKKVEEKLNRENEKLQQLIETTRQSQEWLAELTLSGGDFETIKRSLSSLIEATQELEDEAGDVLSEPKAIYLP